MTPEEERNLAVAHLWVELYNSDPARLCDELLTDDCEGHSRRGAAPAIGREACRDAVWAALARVPDRRIRPVAIAVAGDTAFVELFWGGTAVNGEPVKVHGISRLRIRDGRIASEHVFTAAFDD